jgi:hypothetical protein
MESRLWVVGWAGFSQGLKPTLILLVLRQGEGKNIGAFRRSLERSLRGLFRVYLSATTLRTTEQ